MLERQKATHLSYRNGISHSVTGKIFENIHEKWENGKIKIFKKKILILNYEIPILLINTSNPANSVNEMASRPFKNLI